MSMLTAALIVAIASGLFAWAWARIRRTGVAWLLVLGTPFVLAYSLYWSPVWFGADPLEFRAWAGVFIAPWYLAGAISSVAAYLVARRQHRNRVLAASRATP